MRYQPTFEEYAGPMPFFVVPILRNEQGKKISYSVHLLRTCQVAKKFRFVSYLDLY